MPEDPDTDDPVCPDCQVAHSPPPEAYLPPEGIEEPCPYLEDFLLTEDEVRPEPFDHVEHLRRRKLPVWPTLARELLAAREALTPIDTVGLALRDTRRKLGLSQRAFADAVGLSKTTIARAEAQPGRIVLEQVLDLLGWGGFSLAIVEDANGDAAGDADGGADRSSEQRCRSVRVVEPSRWPTSDLLGKDGAARRFAAHAIVTRATEPPRWTPFPDLRWNNPTPWWSVTRVRRTGPGSSVSGTAEPPRAGCPPPSASVSGTAEPPLAGRPPPSSSVGGTAEPT